MVPTPRLAAPLLAVCLFWAAPARSQDAGPDAPRSQASPEELESWNKRLEGVMAKEGISLNGMFRSRYLHSSIGGLGAVSDRRSEESLEYTSVDFDIRARPNTLTQGRLIFRMHQDWRNFFSDVGNPISTRWLSIDGQAAGFFRYSVGDYRQRYSPLTLWSPDIALLYEPEIYAVRRQDAMGEAFLGGNDRMLQGVNLNVDAALENSGQTLLKELHVNALGARLRNAETDIGAGNKVTAFVEKWPFEKYLTAANADLVAPLGVSLGGSYLLMFDKKGSFNPTLTPAPGTTAIRDPDSAAQFTHVLAGRGGLDIASMLGLSGVTLGFSGEYALSKDDSSNIVIASRMVGADSIRDTSVASRYIDGSALLARFQGGWTGSKAFTFKVGIDYHRNEPDFRNELAQTPSFRGERIMNIENDSARTVLTPLAAQYTSFDALYNHAFKFAPSAANVNNWQKAPFSKNSYHKSIMTQSEMAAFAAGRVDTSVQLVMPFGPATANRDGFGTDVTVGAWEDRIQVVGLFASLKEIEGRRIDTARVLPTTEFTQLGGGLKLEVGAMFGLAYPLTLSGSLVRSSAENAGLANDTVFSARKVESDFINAGLRYKFWKRAALLAGYQEIRTRNTYRQELEDIQRNVGGGIEYKIADGAYVNGALNQVSFEPSAGSLRKEFSQLQTDLFLSVRF